jgi:hypothetical protein
VARSVLPVFHPLILSGLLPPLCSSRLHFALQLRLICPIPVSAMIFAYVIVIYFLLLVGLYVAASNDNLRAVDTPMLPNYSFKSN